MKKTLTAVLAIALILSLAACTSPREDPSEDTSAPPAVSAEPDTPAPGSTDPGTPEDAAPVPPASAPSTPEPEQSKPESKPEQGGNQNQGQSKPEPPAPPVIDDNGNDTNGYGGGVVSIDDILNWGSDQEGIEDGAWDNGFDSIQ